MIFSSVLVLLASIVHVTTATATTTADADLAADGFLPLQVVHSTNAKYFGKRAVELSLAVRSDVAYYAKLNFGTPAQPQFVQLDTGSFELWINPDCDTLSSSDAAFCTAVGSFNTSASSTFESLGTGKELIYGIGSANITYVRDTIGLPGTGSSMKQVQFGVATSTTDEFSGILGIGYGEGLTTLYPNFIDELAAQNVTRVKAFSLALGSKDEQEGVIVFGGVDTRKFAGSLAKLPIVPAASSPDGVPRYWVNMTAVSASASGTVYPNSSTPVFLDSGSTLSLLPPALASSIAADFGADEASSSGYFTVNCSLATRNDTLDFSFDGVTIRVPYNEMIRQSGTSCMLGIQSNSEFSLLGDTFLRSAYVVIDQTNDNVWMAPYVNCGSSPAALANAESLEALTGACISDDATNSTSDASDSSTSTSSALSSTRTSTVASSATSSVTTSATASATASATPSTTSSASAEAPAASSSSTTAASLPTTASLLFTALLTAFLAAALPSAFS